MRWLRLIAAATGVLALMAGAAAGADTLEAIAEQAKPDSEAKPPALDPVTEVVEGDALTHIRISAIAFQNAEDLGQALSGVVGAFLRRDRLQDALVDLSVIRDPTWRAYAQLHFVTYHYERGETSAAADLLKRADALTREILSPEDATMVLRLISQRQAEDGNYAAARQTAARIAGGEQKIDRFIELAEIQAGDRDKKVAAAGVENLRLAFEDAKKAPLEKEPRIALLLKIADQASALGYHKLAQSILEFCNRLLPGAASAAGVPLVAEVAAGLVRAGEGGRAMEIVRSLNTDIRRGYALASVARAFADTGSIEGAVPLFYLARQDAEGQEDGAIKTGLLTHLIHEQTHAGRLADAFTTAGSIADPAAQQAALFAMAEILFHKQQPLEAVKIADYTPDPGLRARILARVADYHLSLGDKKQAQALLLEAVRPTGAKPNPATLAVGLPLVFEVQYAMKRGTTGAAVLAAARKLLDLVPDDPAKIPALTHIARAEMRGQEKDAAERSLGMAWRIAWFNKDKESFPEMLREIAMAQLNIGELLLAFDTAARISESPVADVDALHGSLHQRESPKIKALTAVAIAAARRGEGQLALRAARTITDPRGRAAAYRQIALAFPIQDQQAKLGKGSVPMKPLAPDPQRISPAVEGAPTPAR